jgi:hypothetical protein
MTNTNIMAYGCRRQTVPQTGERFRYHFVTLAVGSALFNLVAFSYWLGHGGLRARAETPLAPNHYREEITMGTCPRCITGVMPEHAPALSRTDNKTRICSACGMVEGIEQMLDCLTPQSLWGVDVSNHNRIEVI